MFRLHIPFALILVLVMATACSGGGDTPTDAAETGPATAATEGAPAAPPPDAQALAADELPIFDSDFDRVCTTQVGFGGATSYEPTERIHPVLLFEETNSGTLITSSVELPAGWAIEQDSDFDDNSELAPIELVACSVIGGRSPNGTICDFDDDDEGPVSLELVDTKYEVTIYTAKTGELLGSETIQAASTRCPIVAFIDEGQTEYVNTPDAEQYTNVLRPYVMP